MTSQLDDLNKIVELLDDALTSQDPRVVNALRSLLSITALTNSEDGNRIAGPIETLISRLSRLERDVEKLTYYENQRQHYTNGSNRSVGYYDQDLLKQQLYADPTFYKITSFK